MTTAPSKNEELAIALRKAREELGLSQEDVARRLGVSTRTVARWESGATEPSSAAHKQRLVEILSSASTGAKVAATLGLIPVVSGLMVGPIGFAIAVGAAATLGGKAATSTWRRLSEASPAIVKALREASDELDVSPERLTASLVTLHVRAKESNLSLDDVVEILRRMGADDT